MVMLYSERRDRIVARLNLHRLVGNPRARFCHLTLKATNEWLIVVANEHMYWFEAKSLHTTPFKLVRTTSFDINPLNLTLLQRFVVTLTHRQPSLGQPGSHMAVSQTATPVKSARDHYSSTPTSDSTPQYYRRQSSRPNVDDIRTASNPLDESIKATEIQDQPSTSLHLDRLNLSHALDEDAGSWTLSCCFFL